MDRFFTIDSVNGSKNKGGGRYKGSSPMMVAKKVAEKLCKNKMMFSIRETTKDSKKKTYHYTAIRNKDRIKVAVNKSFVGGVPFPEKFKLKDMSNLYFKFNENRTFGATTNIEEAAIFFIQEKEFARSVEKLRIYMGDTATYIYYKKDSGSYYSGDSGDSGLDGYEFHVIRYDAYYTVTNIKSNEIFTVVPVVEAP